MPRSFHDHFMTKSSFLPGSRVTLAPKGGEMSHENDFCSPLSDLIFIFVPFFVLVLVIILVLVHVLELIVVFASHEDLQKSSLIPFVGKFSI